MKTRAIASRVVLPALVLFCLISRTASSLGELYELYSPPQVVSMGNAITADATGYLSNYYNPAGLAKATTQRPEIHLFDLEGDLGLAGISGIVASRSFGLYRLVNNLQSNPNSYRFFSLASVPAVSYRNFSLSVLSNYRFAGLYDGTNVNLDTVADLGPTVGVARNFFKNILKLGIAGKAIIRNHWKGAFSPGQLNSDDAIEALGKEGLGIGADIGAIVTLPDRLLPTIGVVWRDVFNTRFTGTHIFNHLSSGTPDAIPQSLNLGASIHPYLSRSIRATIAAEWSHLERFDIALERHMHLGLQLQTADNWWFWFGLNELYFCAGLALRLPGGNLEFGTYGEDYGDGTARTQDRRVLVRYTISFGP